MLEIRPSASLRLLIFTGLAFLAMTGASPAPARGQNQTLTKPLQYEVNVVLKLIHVYVTDKKGNPVPDLVAGDFVVTDNGQTVAITALEKHTIKAQPASPEEAARVEPREEAPVAKPQPGPESSRKFFLYFDFAYNNMRGILKARTAALHFLDDVVRPDDQVAVLTYSAVGGLSFHEYLTSDHAKVRKVLEEIGHQDIRGRATEIEDAYWRLMQDSPGTGAGAAMGTNFRAEADANRQESRSMAQRFILEMTGLARALRLVDGEKHFILFSTGVPNALIYGYTPGNPFYRSGFGSGETVGDNVLRGQNEQMYKEFSAAGCTYYTFDTRETAKEVSLFTYDDVTLATGARSMSTGVTGATDVFKDDKQGGLNSLKRLSDLTGGKYYSNINRYDKNLAQIQAMTGTYYVLGYAINERWDGQFHDVKVAVNRKGCEVRAQAGYFNPKPFSEYTDLEKQIHLFDLALNEKAFSRLPINVPMLALATGAEGLSRLAVLAKVPAEVTAKLKGQKVEFVAIFFDAKGEISEIVREEADPSALRDRDFAFAAGATLSPGDYSCRLVIRDIGTGTSAVAAAKATIVKPQITGLQLGTPLMLEARTGCRLLVPTAKKAKAAFPWGEIYPYDSALYAPVMNECTSAAVNLEAVIPCANAAVQSDLAVTAALVNAATGARSPVAISAMNRTPKGPLEILSLEIPTAGIAPGTYYLHFYAQDRASGALGHSFTTLVVAPR